MNKTISIVFVAPVLIVLLSAVTALFVYIQKMHKRNEKREEDRFNKNIEMATKFVDAINNSKSGLAIISSSLDSNTAIMSKSVDQNTVMLNDLHKYIISKQSK